MSITFKEMQAAAASRRKEERAKRSSSYRAEINKANPKRSRKAQARLDARIADYSNMTSKSGKDYSGYHRPGSNTK